MLVQRFPLAESHTDVNAGVLVPIDLGMWHCLKLPELWHTDIVSVQNAHGPFVAIPIAVVGGAEYSHHL